MKRWPTYILWVVVVVHVALGLYGIDQPVMWGHHGFHVAEHGLAARNLARHNTLAVSRHHGPTAPETESLNFHHPFLFHPYIALAQADGDESPWRARSVPLAFSVLLLLGLWTFVREHRGPVLAALTVVSFVITPMTIAYAHLPDHQVVCMAYLVWFFVGFGRWLRQPSRANLMLWTACALLCGLTDWPWFPVSFVFFTLLAWKVWRADAMVLGDHASQRMRGLGMLVGLAVLVLIPFIGHFAWAAMTDRLGDMFGALQDRRATASNLFLIDVGIWRVFYLHTPTLFLATLIWFAARMRARRWDLFSLAMLSIFVGQSIWLFSVQAEFLVHEYRSFWFVPVGAYAAAQLVISLHLRLQRVLPRWRGASVCIALLCVLGWPLATAAQMAQWSRQTAGSISSPDYKHQRGLLVTVDAVSELTSPQDVVLVHDALQPRVEVFWTLDRTAHVIDSPADVQRWLNQTSDIVVIVPVIALSADNLWRPLFWRSRTLRVDDYAIMDLRPNTPLGVEAATLTWGEAYTAAEAFIKAPFSAPLRLRLGPRSAAVALAKQMRSAPARIDEAQQKPALFEALPRRLKAE